MPASQPAHVLKSVFGYDDFRPLQQAVIDNVLARRDTLVIMPTGGGKSLCYQVPALIFPGLTVVVSPLIALMKDQVEQLRALGVAALFLNSSLSPQEYQAGMARVRRGEVRLLYVAPETLLTSRLFDLLAGLPLDCLAIDEAHCISEWGHDFRPEYRRLVEVRQRFGRAVCLALTATATPRVRQDIKTTLGFQDSNEFVASFDRPNLRIEVAPKIDATRQIVDFLQTVPGQAGIIYCFSRKQVDGLAAVLNHQGYTARPYHAGLEDAVRKANQEAFIRDDAQIIVATIAFGMGINKPNVRFVIHHDLPKSIESYYQEIGRAGRDGLPATCLLLYSAGDVIKQRIFIDEKTGTERQAAEQQLQALVRYAESVVCRRVPLLDYLGERYAADNCGMCDYCQPDTSRPEVDITVLAQKFLSCVARAGEAHDASAIADILTGSRRKTLLARGHDRLSTYGIGTELKREQWRLLALQLIRKGLLTAHGTSQHLRLTPQAYTILKNREPIQGVWPADPREARLQARQAAGAVGAIAHDAALFELLREQRKALADEAGVPPYVIFSDRTLVEMAAYYPQSAESLLRINGVGQVKLERYGADFLDVIHAYCEPRGLHEQWPTRPPEPRPATRSIPSGKELAVAEAYNAGRTLQQVADQFQVQVGTILNHLSHYALGGNRLRPADDLLALSNASPDQQAAALEAFASLGTLYLKPVFEQLNGTVDYDELRLLRLVYLSRQEGR